MHEPMRQKDEDIQFSHFFIPLTTKKCISFLIIIGLLLFFVSLFNNFVGDDNTQILNNPSIQSVHNIPRFFWENRLTTGGQIKLGGQYYKPLLDTYYTIIFSLFGPNPFAFHFFQLILSLANACLVYFLLKIFFKIRLAFLLSLVFLVHPINSETILYIADVQDVLFFFFGMMALWVVLNHQSSKALLLIGIALLCSLLSKETGILFVCIVVFYAGLYKKKIMYPLLGVTALILSVYSILRIHAVGSFTPTIINAPIERLNITERLINTPAIFLFYLKTFLFPWQISGSWQWAYRHIDSYHFFIPLLVDLLFIGMLAFFAGMLYKKMQRKYLGMFVFFCMWFFVGVFFHMQLLPLDQTVADRWFYFPIVGMLGMCGVLLEVLHVQLVQKIVLTIVVVVLIGFSVRTFLRSLDFRNDFILATHDSAVSKDSYNSEYIISHTYYDEGRLQEAKLHALRSIALFPYITNYTNLGAIDSRMGDYRGAKDAYTKALSYGQDRLPYDNLASLALVYGDPGENSAFIKNISLKKFPDDGLLWFNLAVITYMYGDKKAAASDIKKAALYDNDPNVAFINTIISKHRTLRIMVKNGNVTFYTF